MFIMSPLEQFEILPIFQIPFVFTNASLILVIGLLYIYIYISIKNKFIPTRFQQVFETIFNTTIELSYANIGKEGKHFVSLIFVIFFFFLLCILIVLIFFFFILFIL